MTSAWIHQDLNDLRTFLQITQADLALLLQAHTMTVSQVERGQKRMPGRWIPWLEALDKSNSSIVGYALTQARAKREEAGGQPVITEAWRIILKP